MLLFMMVGDAEERRKRRARGKRPADIVPPVTHAPRETIRVELPHPLLASREKIASFLASETRLEVVQQLLKIATDMHADTDVLMMISAREYELLPHRQTLISDL